MCRCLEKTTLILQNSRCGLKKQNLKEVVINLFFTSAKECGAPAGVEFDEYRDEVWIG